MGLLVQKYGGTSVGSPERIAAVAQRVSRAVANGDKIVVVVSAMSGETNRLVDLTNQFGGQPNEMHRDLVLATGEQVTVGLLCIALEKIGITAKGMLGWQVPVLTDNAHSKARIQNISGAHIEAVFEDHQVCVIAGFQGVTGQGDVATLGRGGSDTSAVAIAAAINADECQIYTDVDGVYTTDPRVEPKARKLNSITFEEMLEMASLGSKVLQIRSVEFAGKYKVPLRVLSSFTDENNEGTLISLDNEVSSMEQPLVSGIAFNRDEAKVTIRGVPDTPGAAFSILGPVSEANIDVDMIIQNIALDNTTDFTFTVNRNDFERTIEILKDTSDKLGARGVDGTCDICKVSIVGVGMRSHAGVASTMFKSLSSEGINIQLISTSEIKVSVVINEKYLELAVRALHDAFQLDKAPEKTAEKA
ncbi:MAG TPA: aspartate kinase [Gammaproteobacteria bacterium]|nr:aspartate kinase [Pseudomonadota bacterium]HBF08743.1 aspartate kinase [Gammaproteobacteria bacterium]HCK91864.1 aspartate kinase [Gammaproteobacteria bacterium]|tara:strand:- start:3165 stop:4418 length:1254 start_codon:yes stop_codon:yes gene_type:complete